MGPEACALRLLPAVLKAVMQGNAKRLRKSALLAVSLHDRHVLIGAARGPRSRGPGLSWACDKRDAIDCGRNSNKIDMGMGCMINKKRCKISEKIKHDY